MAVVVRIHSVDDADDEGFEGATPGVEVGDLVLHEPKKLFYVALS